jgi:GNAT superfamily N-acetyltransferase
VELAWFDPEHPAARDLAGAVAVVDAARAIDQPHYPNTTVEVYGAQVRHGWADGPPRTAVARVEHGRVVGVVEVWLPRWDNLHLAGIGVVVDPLERRKGIGRRLFAAGVERARAEGRRTILAHADDRPPANAFLTAMGFSRCRDDVLRRQHVRALDRDRLDRAYADAEPHATGYELVRMPLPTPEALLPAVARMFEAINDAPVGDLEVEDEVFSPERIRADEAARRAHGHRVYRVAARERATGAFAGHTVVSVLGSTPGHAWQGDTSVSRAHRGHRLGLLLKLEMLRWLREAEPQVRVIDTGNAATNSHMISINELLGYEILSRHVAWQRRLDTPDPEAGY